MDEMLREVRQIVDDAEKEARRISDAMCPSVKRMHLHQEVVKMEAELSRLAAENAELRGLLEEAKPYVATCYGFGSAETMRDEQIANELDDRIEAALEAKR